MANRQRPDAAQRIVAAQSIGRPVAISALARLLLKLHQQPPLRLVTKKPDDEERRLLPEIEQG